MLVQRITQLDERPLEAVIRAGALPILTSLAESPAGQILNVNADIAAGELDEEHESLAMVFLNDDRRTSDSACSALTRRTARTS
jgi:N-acetyl-gamma-glutamyl-phosphate reductase/acetylglutamate kinase